MNELRSKTKVGEPVGAVLICGGGIAGIQAALDLTGAGFKVYLIEGSPSIGGKMTVLDKTFPTGDCATCIISPKLVECARNSNIEILTQAEVESLTGEAGRFKVKVRQKARFVDIGRCNACGDCEKVCPVRLPDEFNRGLSSHPAIHKVYAQAVPNAHVITKRERPPCTSACPLGQNVQAYVALISQGKFAEASAVIRRDNPLPLVCGYVCHRPCEIECQQARYGEPISIRGLKKFVMEHDTGVLDELPPRLPERVAIVGAGPAGLAAADRLARLGYGVTIFEALPMPGGMMRVGIPDFRLPREVIEREVGRTLDLGVELRCSSPIGSDLTIDHLLGEGGYSAVFLAVGAQRSARLGIEGEDIEGVRHGIELIRQINLGESISMGPRVVVIGGGNAAMDIARTALRKGASKVTAVYRRTRREMPADSVEVQHAVEEGVEFVFLTNPKRFISSGGRLTGIECLRMALSEDRDASGRRRAVPIAGSEHVIECDEAVIAIGQVPDISFCEKAGIEVNARGLVDADPITFATSRPGVFAGGDVVVGAGTLSEAVAAGLQAAESIDRYIRGEDLTVERTMKGRVWTEQQHQQLEAAQRRLDIRKNTFRVSAGPAGYNAEQAVEEAKRCLACGGCCECMECVEACKAKAIDHDMPDRTVEIEVGAVVLAVGCEEFDARLKGEFGFGRYPNVITNVQFERMLSASGPFLGHIRRLSDDGEVRNIAFIQCVGSRDAAEGYPYCSSICCMAAIKEASIALEHNPGLQVTIFYTDIRAFGKDFDWYYERARARGIRFIRSMVSRVVEVPNSKDLRIAYTHEGKPVEEEFDLVVLSTGLRPSEEALRTARIMGINLNECGFCASNETVPTATSREGIFVAGAFQSPKDIADTVTQASAASAMAMETLAPARGSLIAKKFYPPEKDITDISPRIGVFICHCGSNIASVVDVGFVVESAKVMQFVEYAESATYACADSLQERIKSLVLEHNLNRLVVVSCTPRTHEPLFRETARESGLNPFLVEMANIRDQCSWVHSNDPRAATEKAVDLLRMAVARAARLCPIGTEEVPVTARALIIGGGPSGMTAALSLANQGFRVSLVEKTDKLGGRFRDTGVLSRLTTEVSSNPLIEVSLSSEVRSIQGHVGQFASEVVGPGGKRTISHGVLIVAVGGTVYEPNQYLYGRHGAVLTQADLEGLLDENRLGLSSGATVAMIQCVGSRTEERPFCSRRCCTDAVKNAIRIKEENMDINVIILYRDMRTYGLNELLYQKARELGVLFVRYEPENPPEVTCEERLRIRFTEPELRRVIDVPLDLLVLSTGISPPVDAETISELAKVPLNTNGFFLEAHVKLRPVDFASEGIFLCGSAHSPKDTMENMQQGRAAAARAAAILSKKSLVVGGQVSSVDSRKCAACLTCIRICPYGAPTVSTEGGKSRVEIQMAKCMGCGSCAATCPAGAIQLHHFTDLQITAAIDALLETINR